MTPAERDEVRRVAQETIDAHTLRHSQTGAALPCACSSCLAARAVLRYVPPGDATAPHPWRVRHDGCGMVAITLDALVVAMEPDVARRLAHAIHAAADAADAAEES